MSKKTVRNAQGRRVFIQPYHPASKSAKALSEALGALRARNTTRFRRDDLVINWGSSDCLNILGDQYCNSPLAVALVSNKLNFFYHISEAGLENFIPEFFIHRNQIHAEDCPVVCRTILNGSGGRGIVIANNPEGLVDAPFYTKYIYKKTEFRFHFGKTDEENVFTLIDAQRKARNLDVEDPNWQIRNHDNGFVFVRDGIQETLGYGRAFETSLLVFERTGLDFGAIDVIYNENRGRAYVLEVNSAPGLEGTTLTNYVNYFKQKLEMNN